MADLFRERNISPMLIGETAAAFDSDDFIYELKFDGFRCLAYVDETGVELRNKRNKIVSPIFPELEEIHKGIKGRCILDGEVFVLEDGRTNFAEVQRRTLMGNPFKIQLAAAKLPASFAAFDILYLDGEQLTQQPLMERKKLLEGAVVEQSARLPVY